MKNSKAMVLAFVSLTLSLSSAYGMQKKKGQRGQTPQCHNGVCQQAQPTGRYGRILTITKANIYTGKGSGRAVQRHVPNGPAALVEDVNLQNVQGQEQVVVAQVNQNGANNDANRVVVEDAGALEGVNLQNVQGQEQVVVVQIDQNGANNDASRVVVQDAGALEGVNVQTVQGQEQVVVVQMDQNGANNDANRVVVEDAGALEGVNLQNVQGQEQVVVVQIDQNGANNDASRVVVQDAGALEGVNLQNVQGQEQVVVVQIDQNGANSDANRVAGQDVVEDADLQDDQLVQRIAALNNDVVLDQHVDEDGQLEVDDEEASLIGRNQVAQSWSDCLLRGFMNACSCFRIWE